MKVPQKTPAGKAAKASQPKPQELALEIRRKGKEPLKEPLPPDLVNWLHQLLMDVAPYIVQVQIPGRDSSHDARTDPQVTAQAYVENYLKEMAPRNPAERMLAIQMLWQHARISRLSQVPFQTGVESMKAVNAAIDSAMNVYRRQAATYQDLRTPRPVQFIRGEQVNVAEQQVVAGGPAPVPEKNKPRTNKDSLMASRRRRYSLTPSGLMSLRSSANRNKPWEKSTGPRTKEGKTKSARNSFVHGESSAESIAARRQMHQLLRALGRLDEDGHRLVE